jgi:hypothetical protein
MVRLRVLPTAVENLMKSTGVARPFDVEVFARTLGLYPWRYSAGTHTNGTGRFLDWQKGERLLGLRHSALLFSQYDAPQQRHVFNAFPAPNTMREALDAAVSIGWHTRSQVSGSTNLVEAS